MDKIKNLSLRKTIILYMIISLAVSFFLSALIMRMATEIQSSVWWKYVDQEKYFEIVEEDGIEYLTDVPRPNANEMGRADHQISEICDFLQTYTVLILSVAGSIIAIFLFYKHKLKKPIEELELASQQVGHNNLDFCITYKNADEMGRLCKEFDRMREQLSDNNRQLWKMIEDEKALRVAIAHDIRSPLSVLEGYQEMLLDYFPNEIIDRDKAVEMLQEGMKQIRRMDVFINSMQKMNSLEHRTLKAEQIALPQLEKDIQRELDILVKEKRFHLSVCKTDEFFCGDQEVIMEVLENLLSNAIRYSKEQINIKVSMTSELLTLSVQDDGNGFLDDAEKVTSAFYQKNIKDSLTHAGMGMYIARLYCEKHGGKLLLKNEKSGGAIVTAVFHRIA